MRGGVGATAIVFLALLVAASPAGAGSKPPSVVPSMTVTASPRAARAHGIRLTLILRYEMQCNYPGAGPLVVTFPAALKLPKQFAAGAVKLAGKPVTAKVDGRHVTVTVAPHTGILCDVMGPGSLTLAFTRDARLASPARAGFYRFTATHRKRAFTARLAIKPAA
jgi:hypothetical protein